jgi:phosphatidylglycerophosphate synthase
MTGTHVYGGAVRQVHVGPLTGLLSALLLLVALTVTVRLDVPALLVGAACSLVTCVLLEYGMRVHRMTELGVANRVTLTRATLVAGITALVVQSWSTSVPRSLVVAMSAVALVLDLVDGWLARRTGSVTALGAAFDMETDAFLILVLSAYVVPQVGSWVLLIGLARYLLLVAGAARPWLSGAAPTRRWSKVVAAVQGVALLVVAAHVLPRTAEKAVLVVALALLVESFGRQVVVLRRQRRTQPVSRAPWVGPAVDIAAVVFVWVALMIPDRPDLISVGALLGIPVELLVFLALGAVLPPWWGRVVAVASGLLLAATVALSILDLAFYEGFDRRFDLMNDPSYAGSGLDTLRASVGPVGQVLVMTVIAVGLAAAVSLCVWATLRARRAAHRSPRAWTRVVGVLTVVWAAAAVGGAQISGTPLAAAPATSLVSGQVDQVRADLRDRARFERELGHDPYAATPANHLLTRLRGKDVLLVFVESYGRVAVHGTWFSPPVDETLVHDTDRLASMGFAARSGYLRSPTFGGISWLAHSTMQTGLWINTQQRYNQVVSSGRFTLTQAFHRAGWRTVADVPSNPHGWAQGKRFYHYDKLYGASNVGYRGPRFSYARVPDQYTFAAFNRNELSRPHRRPVFAEIDLDSSHEPWTPLPHIVAWHDLGDGSIYDGMSESHASLFGLLGGNHQTQQNYATSVRYALNSLVSFVRHAHDKKLVMVVLGDHQPATAVSGIGVSHDVPISLIAHDPKVLRRIDGWGWTPGLLPSSRQRVLGMDSFRNRFLAAYGPGAAQ